MRMSLVAGATRLARRPLPVLPVNSAAGILGWQQLLDFTETSYRNYNCTTETTLNRNTKINLHLFLQRQRPDPVLDLTINLKKHRRNINEALCKTCFLSNSLVSRAAEPGRTLRCRKKTPAWGCCNSLCRDISEVLLRSIAGFTQTSVSPQTS